MELKITTFNCENLFGRYRMLDLPWDKRPTGYEERIQVFDVIALEPGRTGAIKPKEIAAKQRITTANAILGAAPDILAVQEVENMSTLRMFNSIYCKNYFDRIISIDGNDARGIDVGLLIRKGCTAVITDVRTHVDDAKDGGYLPSSSRLDARNLGKAIFSRDCLEVDIKIKNSQFTFLVNHFKAQDGKASSTQKRITQSTKVKKLVDGLIADGKKPIVLGDLNIDIKQTDYDNSIDTLYNSTKLNDPFKSLPAVDLWSHYYSSQRKISRLDYILLDKSITVKSTRSEERRVGKECRL